MDIHEVAFHFEMRDLRREAEAIAIHFGPSEEDQARALAHLGSPEVVRQREEFFARRRLMIRPSGERAAEPQRLGVDSELLP